MLLLGAILGLSQLDFQKLLCTPEVHKYPHAEITHTHTHIGTYKP